MLHKRVPLIWAFAGGGLSGAAILVLLQSEADRNQSSTPVVDARAMILDCLGRLNSVSADEHAPEGAATQAKSALTPSVVSVPTNSAIPSGTGVLLPSVAGGTEAADTEPTNEVGSSVAAVLARLESDYRRGTALVASSDAASPNDRPSSAGGSSAPAGADKTATLQPQGAAAPRDVALANTPPPAESPTTREASVALSAPSPSNQQQTQLDPTADSKPEAEVVLASRNSDRGSVVYMGNVQQNIHVGDTYQGAALAAQQMAVLQQQLAMIQYMQLLTLASRFPRAVPPISVNRPTVPISSRHVTAFPSSITNTDNPWGFDFPPTVLVR
ncbi:MAG TPA: hypothetical protein VFQ61_20675 [Polyangiaceae bacterium]|nr:hypothetical protein [Polyangiaceae bacterium]